MIDLSAEQLATVARILRRTAPAHRASAFGSRTQARARAYSDLDLLLSGEQALSTRQLGELEEAFDESDLPFRVDVVDAARASPAFLALIAPHLQALP